MNVQTMPGSLYMIPVLLGEGKPEDVLPERTISIASSLTVFIAENAKSARMFLKQLPGIAAMNTIEVLEMDKHAEKPDFDYFFTRLREGISTGVLSEAGMPGIADPGTDFAAQAHKEKIRVIPLSGPSSIMLALSASGLGGQRFGFQGYLPKEPGELNARIKKLEQQSAADGQTQIFIETPYRSQPLIGRLLEACNPETLLCIAEEITLEGEQIRTATIAEWKKINPDISGKRTVFLLLSQSRKNKNS